MLKKWGKNLCKMMFVIAAIGLLQCVMSVSDVYAAEKNSSSFKEYYNNVLVPKYGLFEKKQTGTMKTYEDKWMDIEGVIGTTVMDFDMDGKKEMLVCIAEPSDNEDSSHIMLRMYESKDGEITMSSSMTFGPYVSGKEKDVQGSISLTSSEWCAASFLVSAVKKGKKRYIVCEDNQVWGCFADGSVQDYWILEYKNNKLRYVKSFTQTGGGSSDFQYTGFSFKNGKRKKSQVYYADEGTGKYKEYSTAIKKFFAQCGMKLNSNAKEYREVNNKSILAKGNKAVKLFNFYNKVTSKNYLTATYKFKATISSKNNWK
jgi:hypothetical protein